MISVTSFWFFALVETCVLLLMLSGLAVWKWLSLRKRVSNLVTTWESTRHTIESAVSGLEMVRRDGGEQVKAKLDYLGVMADLFRKDVQDGIEDWRPVIERTLNLLDRPPPRSVQVPAPVEPTDVEDDDQDTISDVYPSGKDALDEEPSDLDRTQFITAVKTTPLSTEHYQSFIEAVEGQNERLGELKDYKQTVLSLTSKLQRMNVANQKLLEYVRAFSNQDENFRPLQSMLEKFQKSGADIERAVIDLQQDRPQFEPKVTYLVQENQNLAKALIQYRKQIEKVLDERERLEELVKELESKLAIRNKSYSRLHSKFEALRREYITLFELSGKAAQSRGPVSTSL